ncbi:hypothetical protein LguiB_001678 [Lonicera macranthoides]
MKTQKCATFVEATLTHSEDPSLHVNLAENYTLLPHYFHRMKSNENTGTELVFQTANGNLHVMDSL